jgi:hypothetical protein
MGIGYLGARMMWDARRRGVRFDQVLTLGHQSLHLFPAEVAFFRDAYQQEFKGSVASIDDYDWDDYADGFLRDFLGAASVTVLDASSYEGADTIHDMNVPVPTAWHGRYDAIVDGGSLEHIFDIPTAFTNLANMLKVGGTIFVNTPANNMMGHGFYQFSPELMFRIFSEDNGFELQDVLLYEAGYPSVELTKKDTVYKVVDPVQIHKRVGLVNSKPVIMMVEARKVRNVRMFEKPPHQSDYAAMWTAPDGGHAGSTLLHRLRRALSALPPSVQAPLLGRRENWNYSLRNKGFYSRQRWLTRDLS